MSKPSQSALSYKSPLHEMTSTTPTSLWNDSVTLSELTYSIDHGAVGATCNPVIVLDALKKEGHLWNGYIKEIAEKMHSATEDQIAWQFVEDLSAQRARLLEPIFDRHRGRNGRLSIQTDPRYYRDSMALVKQGLRFHGLAANTIVKIPATRAGIAAMEELTYHGVTINATVCFTLPQCVAVAEAIERGLKRRETERKDISNMGPVCTIMCGRLDDWLKVVAERKDILLDPGCLEWAGIAVFKATYRLFCERKYRIRLLSAAFRNHLHWSELIGGDVVISPPYKWQVRFNAGNVKVVPRIQSPVKPEIVDELLLNFEDFRRAYNHDGLSLDEFDTFGPTVRTLRQFIEACHELDMRVRDLLLPNPDMGLV